jgi:hypothetical protein
VRAARGRCRWMISSSVPGEPCSHGRTSRVDRSPSASHAHGRGIWPADAAPWGRPGDRLSLLRRRESGEARFAFGAVGPRPFVVTSQYGCTARRGVEARPPYLRSTRARGLPPRDAAGPDAAAH